MVGLAKEETRPCPHSSKLLVGKHRCLEISRRVDNCGVLAAQLEHARSQIPGGRLMNDLADLGAAGEEDEVPLLCQGVPTGERRGQRRKQEHERLVPGADG